VVSGGATLRAFAANGVLVAFLDIRREARAVLQVELEPKTLFMFCDWFDLDELPAAADGCSFMGRRPVAMAKCVEAANLGTVLAGMYEPGSGTVSGWSRGCSTLGLPPTRQAQLRVLATLELPEPTACTRIGCRRSIPGPDHA
jgi:hypothetical protein